MTSPILVTPEIWSEILQYLCVAALFGGFSAAVLLGNLFEWLDRIFWHRRRRARLARRRAAERVRQGERA